MTVIIAPKNTMPRIDTLWAFLTVDKDGSEGMCAATYGPHGMLLPLIAADPARLDSVTAMAEQLAQTTGMKIKLVRFTAREELREIGGNPS